MKNTLLSLAFAGGVPFFAFNARTQLPPDPQCIISTATTPYTQPGSTYASNPKNFDWKATEWLLWILRDDGTFYSVSAESPFWDPGPVFFPNTTHLAVNSISDPRDFEPGDGWELLMDDRGTSTNPVRVPTITLYNRFEAKVRQFQWMTVEPGLFQTASILFNRSGGPGTPTSAIFEHANSPMNAIDRFDKSVAVEAFNEYTVQGGTWLLSEFAAAYDPCTCVFQSGIITQPRLFKQETINLKLDGTGVSDPVIKNSTGQTPAINKFSSALGKIVGAEGIINKGYKNYDSLLKFQKEMEEHATALDVNPNADAPYKLPEFIKLLPKIGAIATVLEFFIGGGKSSASAKPPSYNSKFMFEGSGSVSFNQNFEPRNIYTPGSLGNPPVGSDFNRIPVYNNPLGIMAVLETPKVEVGFGGPSNHNLITYKLKEQIKYAINPTAGLGSLVQLKGALYFENCIGTTWAESQPDFNMIRVNSTMMRSPFVPLNVLPEYSMESSPQSGGGCYPSPITLEIVATLKKENQPEIFYSARYKTDLAEVPFNPLSPPNPYVGIPENITVENLSLSSDVDFKAWNTITVNTNNIVFNGHFIHLYTAGTLIFKGSHIPAWIQARLNADGEYDFYAPIGPSGGPDPRGDYIPHLWMPGMPNPPQTPTQIGTFCTNAAKYNPLQSLLPPEEDVFARQTGEQLLHPDFKLVPSLTADYTAVYFDLHRSANVCISVANSFGQIEMQDLHEHLEMGTYMKSMDVSRLPQGVHFVIIQLDGKRYTMLRFVKQ